MSIQIQSSNIKIRFSIFSKLLMTILLFSTDTDLCATNIDSLTAILNSQQHDTIRAAAADKLATYFMKSERKRSEELAKELLVIGKKYQHTLLTARGCYLLGMSLELRCADADSILAIYDEGIQLLRNDNKIVDKSLETDLLQMKGRTYERIALPNKALEVLYEALKISRVFDLKYFEVRTLNSIANIHASKKNYDEASKYLKEALKIAKIINRQIDYCLFSLAKLYETTGQPDSALIFYEEVLEITRLNNNQPGRAATLGNMGDIYKKRKDFKQAQKYFEQALQISEQSNYMDGVIVSLNNLASVSYLQADYNKALYYAKKNLELLSKSSLLQTELSIYEMLKKIYKEKGNHKEALKYMEKATVVKDSIFNLERINQMEELTTKYEVQQKINENQQLKAEKKQQATINQQRTIIGIVGILLAALMTAIAFLQKKANDLKKQQNEILEQKVEERTAELLKTTKELSEIKDIRLLEEAKNRFFMNISHEFRTPLTLMLAPLTALLETETLSQKGHQLTKRALHNSRKLLQLVNQILNLTKIDVSTLKLQESTEIFYLFVRRTVANFQSFAQSKDITLKLNYKARTDLQIDIDKEKLEQVINNFLSNAIKFTPKNGTITVHIKDIGGKLQIAVADTGIGIPSEELDKIFERFYQVETDENDAKVKQLNHYMGGTGIGLALCKEYAELMEGKTWAESPNDTNGSTFYFEFAKKEILQTIDRKTLDVIDIEKIAKVETNYLSNIVVSPATSETNKELVLIVEDNYDLRDFIVSLLSDTYQVIAVENGQEALDQLYTMNNLPSLIISDVMMPVLNGFQLLEKLKNSDAFRHIPVVMLTARADMKDKLNALRIGVDDYMLKPFDNQELMTRVQNLITNYNNRKVIESIDKEIVTQEISNPTPSKTLTAQDMEWLKELENHVSNSISDFTLNANKLADKMLVSRSKLFRLTKKVTGLTVREYIKEVRLQKARVLIESGEVESTKEVAYSVGYKHVHHFSTSYKERFGKMPSSLF